MWLSNIIRHFFFFNHTATTVFFNDTATTEIYTLSLHDALPISIPKVHTGCVPAWTKRFLIWRPASRRSQRSASRSCRSMRSEEHTSELQSRQYIVCRLLLEKKKCSLLLENKIPNIGSTQPHHVT